MLSPLSDDEEYIGCTHRICRLGLDCASDPRTALGCTKHACRIHDCYLENLLVHHNLGDHEDDLNLSELALTLFASYCDRHATDNSNGQSRGCYFGEHGAIGGEVWLVLI